MAASKIAKVALAGSFGYAVFMVWGVHWLQLKERENMYQGVVRDEARMALKKKEREEQFMESQRKRAVYEAVQPVEASG